MGYSSNVGSLARALGPDTVRRSYPSHPRHSKAFGCPWQKHPRKLPLRICVARSNSRHILPPVGDVCDVGFPYPTGRFLLDGKEVDASTVVQLLQPCALDERVQRIESITANRTFSVLPIVEGLYDMGNLAAVCRTADALGFGAVHCINKADNKFKVSQRTAAGADKWLDVKMWDSTAECVAAVKAAGYQLVVTHLSQSSVTIQEVDWTRPTAFVLGNEKHGVSQEMVAAADATAIIPMVGMVESFNISVAAALVMYEAQQQRLRRLGRHADLDERQREALKAVMLAKTVRESRSVLSELLSRPAPSWQKGSVKALEKEKAAYEAAVEARSRAGPSSGSSNGVVVNA